MILLPAYHYQFSGLLTAATCLFLVVLVYKKGVNRYLKTMFSLYYLSLFVWSLSLFICTSVYDYHVAYFFTQITHVGAVLIPVLFLHFTFAYLSHISRGQRRLLWILYVVAAFFIVIDLFFRDLFFGDVVPKLSFPYFPNAGIFYTPWVVTFAITVVIAHLVLFRAMMGAVGIRKQQIRFFLLANALGYFGGIGCFLPVYNLPYFPFPYGPYGVFLLSLVSGYAILKYRFVDLKILLKRSIVFAALFAYMIGTFSFTVFIFQNILGSYINVNPFLISAISAAVIISVYEPFRDFLTNATDRYLFQKKQSVKTILNQLAQDALSILEIDKLGRQLLSTLAQTLRPENGILLIRDEQKDCFRTLDSYGDMTVRSSYNAAEPLFQYLVATGHLLNVERLKDGIPQEVRSILDELGAHIVLPLHLKKNLIGVISLGKKKSDQLYSEEELDYLPVAVGQIAIALNNARNTKIRDYYQAEAAQNSQLAMLGVMASGIGHEIRNPLTTIQGAVEYFKEIPALGGFDNKSVADVLGIVTDVGERLETAVRRIESIIDNLRRYSLKPDMTNREDVDVTEAVNNALDFFRQKMEARNITVSKNFETVLPIIRADPYSIDQVVLNLLKNAIDAIDKNGMLSIGLRRTTDHRFLELTVSDTGHGIKDADRDKVFVPFFTTKEKSRIADDTKTQGTGLGLHIVKQIVENHGGSIKFESTYGKGTKFYLFFSTGRDSIKLGGSEKL